jgi:hypothetical protein
LLSSRAVGIKHVIVAMTKADAMRTEAETEEAMQELIMGRTRKVEEMLLSLCFKRHVRACNKKMHDDHSQSLLNTFMILVPDDDQWSCHAMQGEHPNDHHKRAGEQGTD